MSTIYKRSLYSNQQFTQANTFGLTKKEYLVLGGILGGMTNRQIALKLGNSPRTVDCWAHRAIGKIEDHCNLNNLPLSPVLTGKPKRYLAADVFERYFRPDASNQPL